MTPGGTVLYARAALPQKKIEDLRAMDLEQQFSHVKTPMELWEQIRTYEPASGNDIVRAATDADLAWDVKRKPDKDKVRRSMAVLTENGKEMLKQVPNFDWLQMFNFVSSAARL